MSGRPASGGAVPATTTGSPKGDALREAAGRLAATCRERLRVDFPLAPMTSLRVGGPAALYLEAEGDEDLAAAAAAVAATGIPWLPIGRGSNLLVADAGYPGLVVRLGRGYRWARRHGAAGLRAGGAMPLPALAGVALVHGLAGLEFAAAIPGALGGGVRMNAGAHGSSMDRVLESIDLYSMSRSGREVLAAAEAGLGYRRSALPAEVIVVGATMALAPASVGEIRARMEEARAHRRATQPLAEPNCGSVFKNPPGDHAARLVEAVGGKALAVGGVEVSAKHANFVVTREGATAADVAALVSLIQTRVRDRFGVQLETEVQFVGEVGLEPR